MLELLAVLAILGVLVGVATPAVGRARDRVAAAAARDAVAAALARTRAVAIARGGARLVLDLEAGRAQLLTAAGAAASPPLDLADQYGVRLSADGRVDPQVELAFDAYGIGRMASRTVRFRRGAAEGRLTISAYGRPRRW